MDEQHHPDEERDEDDDEVSPVNELDRRHDDEDEGSQDGAEPVDRRPVPPAGFAMAVPMADHPDLRQGEADEDADRVERDQGVGVATEQDQQTRRDSRQEDDPVGIGETVAAERELAGHVAVDREQRRESGERVEAGVGRQEQDQRGRRLEQVEERRVVAEDGSGDEGDDGLTALERRHDAVGVGDERDPDEEDGQEDRHRDHRVAGVLRFGRLERGHAVGDRLRPGEGDRARREGLDDQ